MKFKSLFAIATLAALMFSACEKNEEEVVAAAISVDKTSLEYVAKDAPSQTVELTATRDWRVESKPDWVVLDVSEGKGSSKAQTVTISVEDNDTYDRSGDLVFSIGIRSAAVTVKQAGVNGELAAEGKGTQESPYNVVGALEYVQSLGADVASEEEVYIKGKVSVIEEAFSFSYGNGTFYITDDGSQDTPKFYVFRVYYINGEKWTIVNPQIKVGDEVVVCSKVVNYKGNTPETVMLGSKVENGPYNGHLYSVNGKTEAEVVEPDFSNSEKKSVADFITAADKNNFYVLTGTVSNFNSQYCSFDLTDDSGSIYVYSVANAKDWKDKITNKSTVTLAGAYDYYESKSQHEVVSAWIMELEAAPEQTEFDDITVAEFISKADTEVAYRLTGTVSSFSKGVNSNTGKSWMQFNLTDESGEILVYGFKDGQYDEWNTKISNRGTVSLHGIYKAFTKDGVTTHEVVETVVDKFEAAPEQIVFEEKTIAEFIALADTEVGYKLHGTVSSLSVNSETKKMSFNLTDESNETVKIWGFKDGQFDEWAEKLANGGTAVLHGVYEAYVSNGSTTHEVMETVIESFEAASVVEETAKGDGTLENPYNVPGVKAFIDSESFDAAKKVYVAGKICQIDRAYAASSGKATFWISGDGSIAAEQFEAYNVLYLENKAWVDGQKSLAVGDDVVLYGTVTFYEKNSIYETNSAYLYSLNGSTKDDSPLFGVESQAITVSASTTSATINVTGNVAWTATSTCTLTTATGSTGTSVSGSGASALSVAFAANEDTENTKEYKVTLTTEANVAVKSYEVVITQGKKIETTGEEKTVSVSMSDMATKYNATTNGTQVTSLELADGVVMSVNKDGNNGKFYSSGAEWRLYQSNNAVVTISVGDSNQLVSVKFTYGQSNGGALTDASSNVVNSDQEVSVTGSSASFKVISTESGKTNGQVKIKAVEIVYQ